MTTMLDVQPRGKRNWAALIYIAGDNDLSDSGLSDVQEICDAGASNPDEPDGGKFKGVYVGVEIDTKGEHEGSVRYEITDDGYRTVLERLPERNTGDPQALIDFLSWGFRRFPAEKYLAVVWGHGEGFKLRRGVAFDDTGGSLDIPGLAYALQRLGSTSSHKIDVLGFDACLMSMVEIAYRLRDHVKVLVGSQQSEPGDGWPYREVLRALRVTKDERDLGKAIVDLYDQSYRSRRIGGVTQSAIDLELKQKDHGIDAVMEALGVLGTRLSGLSGTGMQAVLAARRETQGFDYAADYVDLLHFCELIKRELKENEKENETVRKAAEAVETALTGVIINTKAFGPTVPNARGLSVWFPLNPIVYDRFRSSYRSLAAERCPHCEEMRVKADDQDETQVPWVVPGDPCPLSSNGDHEVQPPGKKLLSWTKFLAEIQGAVHGTKA